MEYLIDRISCDKLDCIHKDSCIVNYPISRLRDKKNKSGTYHPTLNIVLSGAFFINCENYDINIKE